jgi:hypothetical protein
MEVKQDWKLTLCTCMERYVARSQINLEQAKRKLVKS